MLPLTLLAYISLYALFESSMAAPTTLSALPHAYDDTKSWGKLREAYSEADHRLFILDSRHTLREPDWNGEAMARTVYVIRALLSDPKNEVAIASGAFLHKLEEHYEGIQGLTLAGEVASVVRDSRGNPISATGTRVGLLPTEDVAKKAKLIIAGIFGNSEAENFKFEEGANIIRFKYPKEYKDSREVSALVKRLENKLGTEYKKYGLTVLHAPDSYRINLNPRTADKGLFVQHMWEEFEGKHNGPLFGLVIGDTKPRDDRLHQAMVQNGQHGVITIPTNKDGRDLEQLLSVQTSAQSKVHGAPETLNLLEYLRYGKPQAQ